MLAHLVDQQVVDGATVGVAHHAVEDLANGGSSYIVCEDMVDEALGVLTRDECLTHVGYIEYTAMLAHGVVLFDNRRVLDRHVEASKVARVRPMLRGDRKGKFVCS